MDIGGLENSGGQHIWKEQQHIKFWSIINDCHQLLILNLLTYHISFIRRQVDKIVHKLVRTAPFITSFYIHYNIPTS